MRVSILALILVAAQAAVAAEVRLGPEVAFSEPHAKPVEDLNLAASDGHVLAAWRQGNELAVSLDGRSIPIVGNPVMVYGEYGGSSIGIASGPNAFLVVWIEND